MKEQKKILVVVTDGTEDIEAVVPIDLFRRAGFDVTVAGEREQVEFARKTKVTADIVLSEIHNFDDFDLIFIPGGATGVQNLLKNQFLSSVLKEFHRKNKYISAICAGPLVLANSGILTETTKLTSHPSVKDALSQFDYSEESVVVSGNIITSRGAGTSIDFALKIIEILKDRETAMKIANDIVYTKSGGKNG